VAASRRSNAEEPRRRGKPATTPEERENQIVAAAYDLAERQISEGSASAQVISHFLKLGSSREKLEQAKIKLENEFLDAKREALESQKRVEELYGEALDAMRAYAGMDSQMPGDDDDYED
jgi:hypothetical protein